MGLHRTLAAGGSSGAADALAQFHERAVQLARTLPGLDEQMRTTAISFSAPVAIRGRRIIIPVDLKPGASRHILMTIASDGDTTMPSRGAFFAALKASKREARRHIKALDRVTT